MSQATRPNDRHIIWSNQNLDVDDWREDYKEFLEANELDDDPNDEQALYEWMVETNGVSRGRGSAFGGVGASGRAREGGVWGIEEFMDSKQISGWDKDAE